MYQVKEKKKTIYVCGPKEKKDNIRVTLATLIIKEMNSKSRENREASFPAFLLQQNKLKLNLNFTPPQRIMSMKRRRAFGYRDWKQMHLGIKIEC